MRLNDIVETSRQVTGTGGRLEKIGHLASCLRRAEAASVETAVAFLSGEVRQRRLGIGYAALRRARPGTAASTSELTLEEVDQTLENVAGAAGAGATRERIRLMHDMLARATPDEQDFLVRLLLGELRQGALEGLMVEAVAKAAAVPVRDVRRALMVAGDLRAVAAAALTEGAAGLDRFAIRLFRPLKPMLAGTAEDAADALAALGEAAFEYKLDGARVQVHKAGGDVRIYSRRLNDVTAAVPEVVEAVERLPARELILDGEVLALGPAGLPHPFQVTMRRFGRKLDVAGLRETLPLSLFFFDCLYLDGEPIVDRPGRDRFGALSAALPAGLVIPRLVTGDRNGAQAFVVEALGHGHEGAMAKSLEAPYAAGARGGGWLKVKPAHTLDLVILAAEWGHGRRSGRLSNLHLGAREPATGEFVMLGKTFKGMTDEMLAWQTEKLLELEVARDAYTVYVRPEVVVEIAFGDIQTSPHYPSGMALRFARVKRYRLDKRAEDADTVEMVRAIHERRKAAE